MSEIPVYIALGANLGDRRGNLMDAISQLRRKLAVKKVSSVYETEPAYVTDQPQFLNMVLCASVDPAVLPPRELLRFLQNIERRMGRDREHTVRFGPRPIDLDILLYGDLQIDEHDLIIPHPRLTDRAFVLVPLAEIAPNLVPPGLSQSVAELADAKDRQGKIVRVERGLTMRFSRDVQEEAPQARLSLTKAGVSGLRRVVRLRGGPREELFYAEMDLFVELHPDRKGAHMSRFSDTVEEVLAEVSLEHVPNLETLAERVARQVLTGQGATRSDVHIRAQFPLERHAPVSGKLTQEIYTLIGIAAATETQAVQVVGVEAEGMMACPCAQDMIGTYARERLLESGFTAEQADAALAVVPLATHNQRGRGTLLVGAPTPIDAQDLVTIVEGAMSSENYDLLKRPDELFVVAKAHRHPRFVEDAVREMLYGLLELFPDLPEDAFVLSRQVNQETIHKHDVYAERSGTVGELRREIVDGDYVSPHTTLDSWLRARLNGGR
jgi:GTP cyclohydrolase IV